MKILKPQNASLLATFSVADILSDRLKRSLKRIRNKGCVMAGTSHMNGLIISDNMAGEPWAHKWNRGAVKISNHNTKFYVISYSLVPRVGEVKVPFFCN
jgi:hypothetical protein